MFYWNSVLYVKNVRGKEMLEEPNILEKILTGHDTFPVWLRNKTLNSPVEKSRAFKI
jgi:hypothetical protein